MDGSLGLVEYRASYGAKNLSSSSSLITCIKISIQVCLWYGWWGWACLCCFCGAKMSKSQSWPKWATNTPLAQGGFFQMKFVNIAFFLDLGLSSAACISLEDSRGFHLRRSLLFKRFKIHIESKTAFDVLCRNMDEWCSYVWEAWMLLWWARDQMWKKCFIQRWTNPFSENQIQLDNSQLGSTQPWAQRKLKDWGQGGMGIWWFWLYWWIWWFW